MHADEANKYELVEVIHPHDEAILVAFDLENCTLVRQKYILTVISGQIFRCIPVRLADMVVPGLQGVTRVGVGFPVLE